MKTYFDIEGDGGSNVIEQVVGLRERISANLSSIRHIVAVGSGKGGVGKSTLTAQLAAALRQRGAEVAVLDADINGPTQARLFGLQRAMVIPGERGLVLPRSRDGIRVLSFGTLVPETEAVSFDSVASGESHTWRATREFAVLADLLASVEWGTLDYLLIDLPPGAERTQQYAEFLGPRARIALVTIPSQVSVGVVARSVAALRRSGIEVIGYIENMDGYFCHECGRVKPLFPSGHGARLELPRLGSVPFDPELAERCDRGTPVGGEPGVPGAGALREIIGNLERALETT